MAITCASTSPVILLSTGGVLRFLRYMHSIPLTLYSFKTRLTVCFFVLNKSANSSVVYCFCPSDPIYQSSMGQRFMFIIRPSGRCLYDLCLLTPRGLQLSPLGISRYSLLHRNLHTLLTNLRNDNSAALGRECGSAVCCCGRAEGNAINSEEINSLVCIKTREGDETSF